MASAERPRHVLIADDEEDVCSHLKQYLDRKGLIVVCALSGDKAKELIEKEKFDYFLLDCSMPEVTGIELIQLARERNPEAKVILISGFPSVDSDMVNRLGGDVFIHKPIQLNEIDKIFQ